MTMVVVGSPDRGLVGIGRGRAVTTPRAMDAGFHKGQSLDSHVDGDGRY
jgi:ribosomal protein S5